MSDLVRFDDLKRGIGGIARLARSDPQKALMGRVLFFIEHLEKKNGWISVKDRLPRSVINKVLVWLEHEDLNGYIGYGHYEKFQDTEIWYDLEHDEQFAKRGYTVTHWMPLPEPPKEVDWNA